VTFSELAPAKLNLALHVRKRRVDGYHELETLFAFAADGDMIAASEGDQLRLTIEGPMAAGLSNTENLVLDAARLLAGHAGRGAGVHLRLTKNLPVASGIGGGSADAAATLRLLNRFWRLGYDEEALAKLAERLGADVPACVFGRTMWGGGIGDVLIPAESTELAAKPLLLVNPMIAVATGPVFAAWDGIDHGPLERDAALQSLPRARNDLQPGAVGICPEIQQVLKALEANPGVLLSRMSGSGATCFAVFENGAAMRAAHGRLADAHPGWWYLPTMLKGA
jgi:4-diphosphocytidyl-2-C-methyl-D-erythritol kinase